MRKRRQGNEEVEQDLMADAEDRAPSGATDEPGGRHASGPGDATQVSPSAAASGARRVTPVDIQQKVFRSAFRGYAEREVDVFLDEVTEEMARLLAENRTIRDQLQRAEMRATTPLGFADDRTMASAREEAAALLQQARDEADRIVRQAGDDAERGRAEARSMGDQPAEEPAEPAAATSGPPPRDFIHREREFLQRMAELIQTHAEAVREDLRRSRPVTGAAASENLVAEPVAPQERATASDASPPTQESTKLGVSADEAAALGSAEVGMVDVDVSEPVTPPDLSVSAESPGTPAPTHQTEDTAPADREPRDLSGDVDFVVDLERGEATEQPGMGDELLPWESESARPEEPQTDAAHGEEHVVADDATVAADTHPVEDEGRVDERAGAAAVRPFGPAATTAGGLHGGQADAPPPWERRSGDEREEEGRSLRELFWGED
jgi:DivIVA domain-containing protein